VDRLRLVGDDIAGALVSGEKVPDARVRGWVATMGRLHVGAVMRLATAVWKVRREAGKPYPDERSAARLYRRMLRVAFRDPIELRDLAVDGNDLKEAGIAGGRDLGRILESLLRRVIEEPMLNRTDWLLQEGLRLYREKGN
jgi:tRNA nucleotidyltransferase (CCA-adding enzyme)